MRSIDQNNAVLMLTKALKTSINQDKWLWATTVFANYQTTQSTTNTLQ